MGGGGNEAAGRFFQAVASGDLKKTREMLAECPELARVADSNGKTVLHLAVEGDEEAVIEALLGAGAAIDAQTSWGHTPLQWAGVLGCRKAARTLIANGAQGLNLPTVAGLGMIEKIPAFWSSEGRLLEEAGFRRAIRNPDGSWSRSEPITDPREIVSEAFYLACRNGHLKIAKWLLDRGADVHHPGFFGATGLHWAALNGHAETVRFLVGAGADLEAADNQFGGTPVSWANEGRHPEVVDLLLELGARCTPGQAAAFGKLDKLKSLLESNPSLTLETGREEWSPLWQAALWRRREVVDWLIRRGVDVNRPTVAGETPLHGAAAGGDPEILKALLESGADPDGRNDSALTPLHVAAARGLEQVVVLLLEAGADPAALTSSGRSGAELAQKNGHPELAERLRRWAARPGP